MNQSRLAVCTIIAKNYVSFARTLCRSFREHNPGVRFFTLVIDQWDGFIRRTNEPYEIISLSDLKIPDVPSMAFKYDITEFSTAVKPYLLEYLLNSKGIDKLLYLDPDILVTESLARLFEVLENNDFIVTPHIDADYPEDGCVPTDNDVLVTGIYNLGFFGIRRGEVTERFLKWWCRKLQNKCIRDVSEGYFVDQRFIDLAIGLFPGFHVERDTGYNVAYWNLHSRRLSFESGIWLCNGSPLFFFHFSGFKPELPNLISKYSNRYTFADRPDIAPLFAEYSRRLFEHDYTETCQWPYSFGHFSNGEAIDPKTRLNYRDALERGLRIGDPFLSRESTESQILETNDDLTNGLRIKNIARSLTPPFIWETLGKSKKLLQER